MKNANSFYQKPKDAVLVFADGSKFYGYGIGNYGSTIGEICFNTSITGYQEILTDPSYSGQIINFTFPHIGNIGVNGNDIEAKKVRANGLIIRELITSPSNYRATNSFNDWLKINSLTGICGVDTRKITKKIRQQGAKNVAIIFDKNLDAQNINKTYDQIRGSIDLAGVELASLASENKSYDWNNEAKWNHENNNFNKTNNKLFKIVAIDYGAKLNILRCLADVGADIAVVPANAKFEDIIKHQPDGVFLSNGPGDPYETGKYAISTIKKILENNIPLFGICLGHQLLALSVGAKTIKMQQGHRGANHPVQNLSTKKVEITSQNHGFCVDKSSLPNNVEITHISLFDESIEGIKLKDKPAFSVQYHPESSPGPSDSFYLFQEFVELIKKNRK
ncbi:MAG: carbamoyl-phosphate synthase small subunit [Proteobacteria bacterium]|nr:carbamoyl-phosphate synthase small subunit [Pseudomonadota bacterium]NCA28695.1 carbamoyl-phosphate synthase small subunit [Pseudomonadota bacterium]